MYKLSLIIAVHKHPDALEKIFASLQNQSFKDFEVVIAEDGMDDGIAALVREYADAFKYPIVHACQEHNGFRKTIIANKAVMASHAEYLVFIDGDCVLHHRFLERHYVNRRPRTILAGRRVLLDEKITARITLSDITTRRIERPWFWWKHCPAQDIKKGIYVPFSCAIENLFLSRFAILGCNFSVHKNDYCAINGYDERIIGRGMEDSNLYERFRVDGYPVRNISREALQYHLFHTFAPVPYDKETMRYFCFPKESWTPYGIVKSSEPAL
jgi:glycosyltransferase involved in cell wall biosynthesis